MGLDPITMLAGSSLIGGLMGGDAASSAADAQVQASQQAAAAQRAMFDKTVELNSPFRQAGVGAMSKLNGLLGIGSPGMVGPDGRPIASAGSGSVDPITQAYHDLLGRDPEAAGMANWQGHLNNGESIDQVRAEIAANPEAQMPHAAWSDPVAASSGAMPDPSFGSLLKPFGKEDFQLDPGIQFQTQMGNQALTSSAAAKDGVLSGSALKDFIGYNQGMAGTGYQSAFDRYMANKGFTLGSLMDMTKVGQGAASGVTSAAPSFSSGIAGSLTGAGNAQAAGQVGMANALSGGIGGAGNAYFLSSLLNKSPAASGGLGVPGFSAMGTYG